MWTKRDGTRIAVSDMSIDHLSNTIAMLERIRLPRNTLPDDEYDYSIYDHSFDQMYDKYLWARSWLPVLRQELKKRGCKSCRIEKQDQCEHNVLRCVDCDALLKIYFMLSEVVDDG